MVIGKCTDVFRGIFSWIGRGLRGGRYMGVSFHGIFQQLCLWGRLTPSHSPGEGLQVTNFDMCLHVVCSMVIGKCTDVFRRIFLG